MGSDCFSPLKHESEPYTEQGDLLLNKREVRSPPHTIHKRKQSQRAINDLDNVDPIPQTSNLLKKLLLYPLEDNEAVIKMIEKEDVPQ